VSQLQKIVHLLPMILVTLIGGGAAFSANFISFHMISRLNARLPPDKQVSHYWWGAQIYKQFNQAFPNDKLMIGLVACLFTMVLSFIIGFFGILVLSRRNSASL
jgi:hypothetical protein